MSAITAVIVTYNRKAELLRCIKAILAQTHKVTSILVVDNASADTFNFMYRELYQSGDGKIPTLLIDDLMVLPGINNADIYYEYKETNTGGSGGFYTGLKIANEVLNSEYFWLMDDDGYPSEDCLEKQLSLTESLTEHYDYAMPVSINIENHTELSWPTIKRNRGKTIYYDELKRSWGAIMNYVYPFNGALLSKFCIDSVGYVNKDFFIWGDEYEHYWRCKKHHIDPVTAMDALFYHPAKKLPLVPIMCGFFHVPYSESKLRMVCLIRNHTYIYLHYDKKIKIALKFFMYTWLFLITKNFDMDGYKLYLQSVADAFNNDFTRHLKYL
ncbi:glycosyltransferase, family 2 [Treponema primitia ZAS-2]|uniref:Glycosyltransferase, family 2 n=1 Tax=Treponema primitia (strain ATCC BAA-887 / DSM 12427 / ZAS-2) TaxID=545694 RepID=F5YGP3_TREPZ|nr:glycosyltransferase [Treponema primitia]AEF86711.1 glycosyltransferase, family 2 [Treponema primitia ZAS-2]